MKIRFPTLRRVHFIVGSLITALILSMMAWRAQGAEADASRAGGEAQSRVDDLRERKNRVASLGLELNVIDAISNIQVLQAVGRDESGAYLGMQSADGAVEMAVRRFEPIALEYIELLRPSDHEFGVLISRHQELVRAFRSDPALTFTSYTGFVRDLQVRAARENVAIVDALNTAESEVTEWRSRETTLRGWSRLWQVLALIFAILPTALGEAMPRRPKLNPTT